MNIKRADKFVAFLLGEILSPRCKVCRGYGLHAFGDATPMGPMDASDGLPTRKCNECGANANPTWRMI